MADLKNLLMEDSENGMKAKIILIWLMVLPMIALTFLINNSLGESLFEVYIVVVICSSLGWAIIDFFKQFI